MDAYEDMIRHTSTREAPWYVVPADNKWFARLVVAAALVDALDRLDLRLPKVSRAQLDEMQRIRKALEAGEERLFSPPPIPPPKGREEVPLPPRPGFRHQGRPHASRPPPPGPPPLAPRG